MRRSATVERGWWLLMAFAAASLLLHGLAFYGSRGWSLFGPQVASVGQGEVEVSLPPLPPVPKPATREAAKTPPKPVETPAPKAPTTPKVVARRDNNVPVPFAPKPVPKIRGVAPKDAERPVSKTETSPDPVEIPQPLPVPTTRPPQIAGGKFPDRALTPLPLGVESGDRLTTLIPQPRVLRDVPISQKPLGPRDVKSGAGAAPGPTPTVTAKAPDVAEPLSSGNSGTTGGTGNPQGATIGNSADEGGSGAGLRRGLPFGDPGGVLEGDDPNGGGGTGGGPGGPGTGRFYSTRRGGGAGAPVRVIYVLDISGSMQEDNRLDKAKQALKQALQELTPQDTFNVIIFSDEAFAYARTPRPATVGRISGGEAFVENMQPHGATNYSAALTLAFAQPDATHIVFMSDGLPTLGVGVNDQTMELEGDTLRRWVRQQNAGRTHILTLGLGSGPKWDGIELLRDIANDNGGTFKYIDLKRR
ncbi:MAG: VWA domain-containing protein [Cytophagales bacterium]|nr:VWA domain-containing protein [Armatimonadota bacterium]